MDIVNIHCSDCGGLIGVRRQNFGRLVRCPLCQKAILATAPPAPAIDLQTAETELLEPIEVPMAREEEESIFAPPETASDDLFGEAPAPVIEIPSDLTLEIPPSPSSTANTTILPAPPEEPVSLETTQPHLPAASAPASPQPVAPPPASAAVQDVEPLAFAAPTAPIPAVTEPEGQFWDSPAQEAGKIAVPDTRRLRRPSMVVPILLIFLVPYSVLTTAFIVYMIVVQRSLQPHQDPLERMLEEDGKEGIKRVKPIHYDAPVPARLRVGLHEILRVGAVEVEPLKVVRNGEELTLYLRVRNSSRDLLFNPLPAKFLRYTRGVMTAPKPFTFLDGGKTKIFGGVLEWQERAHKDKWVSAAELEPGESRTVRLTTAWQDHARVKNLLQSEPTMLLWRVHLRRGLETIAGQERVITCVVGVSFPVERIGTS
jgi:hypothetical protein